jgi:hypothetical protein
MIRTRTAGRRVSRRRSGWRWTPSPRAMPTAPALTTRQAFQFHGVVKRELKADDAGDQRRADRHHRRLRRRQPQRAWSAPIRSNRALHAEVHAGRREAVRAPAAEHPRLPRDLARRGKVAQVGRAKPSRSTAHLPAAQVQDRHSRCRRSTTSTCSRRTSASSPSSRRACWSATTSRSAAAWAPRTATRDLSAPRRRHRLRHARAAARRGRDRGADRSATSATARTAQARAPQVHHRRSRPRLVQGGSRTPRRVPARAGAAVRVQRHNGDRFGWVEGEDGRWHLTLRILAGRIADRGPCAHLTGLREIAQVHIAASSAHPEPEPRHRRIVPPRERARIDALLAKHGCMDLHDLTRRRCALNALACVALPTCRWRWPRPSATCPTSSPGSSALLAAHGLRDEPILLRISGCPNGCSRPVPRRDRAGRQGAGPLQPDARRRPRGERLNRLYRENIDEAAILAALDPLFARYAGERLTNEGFRRFPGARRHRPPRTHQTHSHGVAHESARPGRGRRRRPRARRAQPLAGARTRPTASHGRSAAGRNHVLSSSFGAQSAVALHLVTQQCARTSR